jgi:hypothetical protein
VRHVAPLEQKALYRAVDSATAPDGCGYGIDVLDRLARSYARGAYGLLTSCEKARSGADGRLRRSQPSP